MTTNPMNPLLLWEAHWPAQQTLSSSQALSSASDPALENSAVVIPGLQTMGPDLTAHQGPVIALPQDATWGDAGSFGPFGVYHCIWPPSGLRTFASLWTQTKHAASAHPQKQLGAWPKRKAKMGELPDSNTTRPQPTHGGGA